MSLVELDLEDPVTVVVDKLKDNLSPVAIEGPTGFSRGGYSRSDFGPLPQVLPIEGEEDAKAIRSEISLQQDPAHGVIFVYEAGYTSTDKARQDFRDKSARVSIDIRTILGRSALKALFNETKRIIILIHKTPGGNWRFITPVSRLNLTNKKTGLWRIVYDVRLVKISDCAWA